MQTPRRPYLLWPAALLFPLLAAASLTQLIYRADGFLWVFLLYATVETQDSMAFLFGRLFGKRPVLPRLSPHKTSEGVLAGILFGGAMAVTLSHALLGMDIRQSLGVAALLVLAGLFGDLFTSRLKRVAGVKDFSPVSVLHGGLLDIYDSTLFAAVVLALIIEGAGL
jgi:phosphatidate cytidylyltransferase